MSLTTRPSLEHAGSSNFQVKLLDGDGDRVESLANEIGSFQGSMAIKIDETAAYLLDVNADGSWSIRFETRAAMAQSKAPVTLTGEGQKATEFFELEKGLWIVALEHAGSSNFQVKILDGDGDVVESLANEIGDFQGSMAIKIDKTAAYLLDVNADGSWSIGFSLPD